MSKSETDHKREKKDKKKKRSPESSLSEELKVSKIKIKKDLDDDKKRIKKKKLKRKKKKEDELNKKQQLSAGVADKIELVNEFKSAISQDHKSFDTKKFSDLDALKKLASFTKKKKKKDQKVKEKLVKKPAPAKVTPGTPTE